MMSAEERAAAVGRALGRLGRYDAPLREFEHTTYTIDIVCDQGAYFDLKRHRMMTQSPQAPTVDLGYAVPSAIDEAGFGRHYRDAVDDVQPPVAVEDRVEPHAVEAIIAAGPVEGLGEVPLEFRTELLAQAGADVVLQFAGECVAAGARA